jgi:hypothetical protein
MEGYGTPMGDGKRERIWILGLFAGLLLLTAALVWHDLGAREVLGRDENATITKLDQPDLLAVLEATHMKVTGQPGNMQPLYFLLQYPFWSLTGRSAFMFRFLSSAFGLLAVALTYKLGQALFRREVGLVGALLTALLMLQVEYSQIARPYTLLALFSLASAYFLVRALSTDRPLHWAGFVVTAALNFYTHYNALLVLVVEGLFAGVVWLRLVVAVLKGQQSPRRLAGPILAFLVVGILCLPGLIRLVRLAGEGVSAKGQVELTTQFFLRFLYKIGLTTAWLRGLILGFMGLGLLSSLYRRRWQAALLSVLWLTVPFVILAAMQQPRPFVERYVIFVPPVALLLTGEGVAAAAGWLARLGRRGRARGLRWAVTLATGLALLLVGPLRAYYIANRQEDRLDQTLAVVERDARQGDVIIVSPRFLVRPLAADGAEVLYLTEHLTLTEFEELLSSHQRTWVLYTSYLPPIELQEPLDQWIQARDDDFVRVPIKAINALAFYDQGPDGPESLLLDRIALLEELAGISADSQEAWLRYEVLAQAYESLAALYDSQGASTLAAEFRNRAEEARATAPRPW